MLKDYRQKNPIGKCGKVSFSKRDAATKRNFLMKEGTEKYLRIYRCPICTGSPWHLTNTKDWDRGDVV